MKLYSTVESENKYIWTKFRSIQRNGKQDLFADFQRSEQNAHFHCRGQNKDGGPIIQHGDQTHFSYIIYKYYWTKHEKKTFIEIYQSIQTQSRSNKLVFRLSNKSSMFMEYVHVHVQHEKMAQYHPQFIHQFSAHTLNS